MPCDEMPRGLSSETYRRRWALCFFLFAATTLNYLDRQTVAILAPTIRHVMRIDNESLGWLFSCFYYAYTVAQFGSGFFLDRFDVRVIYGLAVAGWSLTAALTGFSGGFTSLLIFRLLLGVTESANWPGALRMVGMAFPSRERALANGIFTSGTSIGAVIAPAFVLGVSALWDWRVPFFALGSAGLIWAIFWLRFSRSLELSQTAAGAEAEPARLTAEHTFFRRPAFWSVFVVTICVNPAQYFFLNWLPTYLAQERGISSARSMAQLLTIIYIALDLGNVSAGALIWLTVRAGVTMSMARRLVFLIASVMSVNAAAVPFVHGQIASTILLCGATFGLGTWVSLYLTLAQEVDPSRVSTVAGFLGGSGALAGAVAMWAVGRVTARTGSFAIPLAGVPAACFVASLAAWKATASRIVR